MKVIAVALEGPGEAGESSGCPGCGGEVSFATKTADIESDSGLDNEGVVWYCESCSPWEINERKGKTL